MFVVGCELPDYGAHDSSKLCLRFIGGYDAGSKLEAARCFRKLDAICFQRTLHLVSCMNLLYDALSK